MENCWLAKVKVGKHIPSFKREKQTSCMQKHIQSFICHWLQQISVHLFITCSLRIVYIVSIAQSTDILRIPPALCAYLGIRYFVYNAYSTNLLHRWLNFCAVDWYPAHSTNFMRKQLMFCVLHQRYAYTCASHTVYMLFTPFIFCAVDWYCAHSADFAYSSRICYALRTPHLLHTQPILFAYLRIACNVYNTYSVYLLRILLTLYAVAWPSTQLTDNSAHSLHIAYSAIYYILMAFSLRITCFIYSIYSLYLLRSPQSFAHSANLLRTSPILRASMRIANIEYIAYSVYLLRRWLVLYAVDWYSTHSASILRTPQSITYSAICYILAHWVLYILCTLFIPYALWQRSAHWVSFAHSTICCGLIRLLRRPMHCVLLIHCVLRLLFTYSAYLLRSSITFSAIILRIAQLISSTLYLLRTPPTFCAYLRIMYAVYHIYLSDLLRSSLTFCVGGWYSGNLRILCALRTSYTLRTQQAILCA